MSWIISFFHKASMLYNYHWLKPVILTKEQKVSIRGRALEKNTTFKTNQGHTGVTGMLYTKREI